MSDITQKMEELRAEAYVCRQCSLCETRTNVVFGEGNPESPLMIIGEGPGATEDATGRPFVGRAGQLLDQALAENCMSRKHVFICNVIKCRACLIEGSSIKNRPPKIEEINACHSWLLKQLEIMKPLVILSLGAPSANEIIHPDFRITKERGLWFPTEYAKTAMAALHPAYVLRQMNQGDMNAKASLIRDIGAAKDKAKELKIEMRNSANSVL
ncbi:MAG: uracil-DNA glycosylase [Armatimonadota bacterium]